MNPVSADNRRAEKLLRLALDARTPEEEAVAALRAFRRLGMEWTEAAGTLSEAVTASLPLRRQQDAARGQQRGAGPPPWPDTPWNQHNAYWYSSNGHESFEEMLGRARQAAWQRQEQERVRREREEYIKARQREAEPRAGARPSSTFWFGQHHGQTIEHVVATDPTYLEWALAHLRDLPPAFRDAMEAALKARGHAA